MIKLIIAAGAALTLGFFAAEPAAAQADDCATTGGYPAGSPGAVMAQMRNISNGSYAACVERRRAQQPTVNWSESQITAAGRRAVTDHLRDPGSARFRNVSRHQLQNGTSVFCGEVNARNGMGGYTGFVRFEAAVSNRGTSSSQIDDQDGLAGAYFSSAWAQVCGRGGGTPVQF